MDLDSQSTQINKRIECYSIAERSFGPLHVVCYESKWIILWNRYTIIVKDVNNLKESQIIHHPGVLIKSVCVVRNIFLCIDSDNNVHFNTLKKHESYGRILDKFNCKQILKGVICITYNGCEIFALLKKGSNYYVFVFSLIGNSKMKFSRSYEIKSNIDFIQPSEFTTQIYVKSLSYFSVDFLQKVLHIDMLHIALESQILFILNYDSIYWKILNDDDMKDLSILYSCPTPVNNVFFDEELCTKVYLDLVTGSIIILTCDIINKSIDIETIHLNTPIEKIIHIDHTVVYTDAKEMWYTTFEITDEEPTVRHRLLKTSAPYDIAYDVKNGLMYCTTLHNALYVFKLDSNDSFASKVIGDKDDFIPLPKSLSRSKVILNEIIAESKINDEILKSIVEENNLITIIALNRKSDLVVEHLLTSIVIYENAHDILKDKEIICVSNQNIYYNDDIEIYVITFEVSKIFKDKFNEMLKTNYKLWHLNIQLRSHAAYDAACCSVELKNSDCIKFAVPIAKNMLKLPIKAEIKLIAFIPSSHRKDHHFWCILPSKTIEIDSTYHLELPVEKNLLKRYYCLKEVSNLTNSIVNIAVKNCGTICNIEHIAKSPDVQIYYYIRLLKTFDDIASEFTECFLKNVNPDRSKRLSLKMLHKDFSQCQKEVKMNVINNTIDLSINKTDSDKYRLKIVGSDSKTCWDIYSSAFEIFRCLNKEGKDEFVVPHFEFMILQNLREAVSSIITSNEEPDLEVLLNISEEFYREIIGILPV